MSQDVRPQEARWTSLAISKETRDLLRDLKRRDFGAEETWDHFLRRVAGLPESMRAGVPA